MSGYLDAYIEALKKEIVFFADQMPGGVNVHTIYFGGGTPTLMTPVQFGKILNEIWARYHLAADPEITTEANPLRLTTAYLSKLRGMGINRLSMGMQSARPEELKILGRRHTLEDVSKSMVEARAAGFDNLSLDLIFGIPGQTLKTFQESIGAALALEPQHLSVYSLTVEEGTPLERMLRAGQVPAIDEEAAADMYEWVMGYLPDKGLSQYEISNWAAGESLRCRHNLQYWHDQPYLGFGAGAHSYLSQRRWANAPVIGDYIGRLDAADGGRLDQAPAAVEIIQLDESDEIQEYMLMGLRLVEEGISEKDFRARFGRKLASIYEKEISGLIKMGLLDRIQQDEGDRYRLTQKGKMLGNQVFLQFVQG